MIRGIFRLIFQAITLIIIVAVGTAIWITFDGLSDKNDHADVAVVPGGAILRDGLPGPILRARLERTVALYRQNKFPLVIVSGAVEDGGFDEAAAMSHYLLEHQVPASAIIQDKVGTHTSETGVDVARIMRRRHLRSAMIITQYYHITRTKLSLRHAGVKDIKQVHVGEVRPDDVYMLGREVLAFYDYLFKFYAQPAAQTVKEEANVDGEKAKESAGQAREHVHDKLKSLDKQ